MRDHGSAAKQPRRKDVSSSQLVRLTEYRCPFDKGSPVAVEQFSEATISIVRSGAFGFRSDRDDQLLSKGFVLLANPGQYYEISHDHCGGDQCLIFRFDEAALEEISGRENTSGVRRYFSRSVLPPLPRLDGLRQLIERDSSAFGLEEVGLALAACVLEFAAAHPHRAAPTLLPSRRMRDTIFAALEHIERNAAQELSLARVAGAVGLSPFHFLRLFRRETGVTPHRFLMQTRIRNAIELLRDTQQPVTDIAFAVGFADLSNFTNFFRRELGCAPSQFRKAEPRGWAAAMRRKLRTAPARRGNRKIYQAEEASLP